MRTLRPHLLLLALTFLPLRAPAQSTIPAIQNSEFSIQDSIPLSPGSRILKTFDFEERKLGNFESIPMFWSKVAGHGFPAYSSGTFDHTTFRSATAGGAAGGNTSFKLDIDGGSAAFRYTPGKLPINPNADYYIVGYVKTTPLLHARAQISVWFGDDKDQLLKPAEIHFHSQPYASPKNPESETRTPEPDSGWHLLHLFIPAPAPQLRGVKSLVIQLGLLQPQELASEGAGQGPSTPDNQPDLGNFALYQQDLHGSAWFDDITIIQLPRISVAVPSTIPANLFAPNQPIELDLTVSDMASPPAPTIATTTAPKSDGLQSVGSAPAANVPASTQDAGLAGIRTHNSFSPLTATLKITDPDGLLFASEKFTIPAAVSSAENAAPWTHHYTHPPLPPGLYLAALEVTDPASGQGEGALIARRQTRFLSLAPPFVNPVNPAPDFGFVLPLTTPGADLGPQIPHILRLTNAGLLQLPIWGASAGLGEGGGRNDLSEDALLHGDAPLDTLLTSLQRLDVRIIANFSQLPSILAEKFAAAAATRPVTQDSALGAQNLVPKESILTLAHADPALWRPYISFLLARYANRIDYWEFGSPAEPYCGVALPTGTQPATLPAKNASDYPQLFARTSAEMSSLVDPNHLLVPWNALFDFDSKLYPNARLDLVLPASIKPSQIPAYLDNFKQSTGGSLLAHIDPLPSDRNHHREARLADFAQRIVYARYCAPAAVLIDLPLEHNPALGAFSPRNEPDEILAVYRTLIQAIGGSDSAPHEPRQLALAPGLKTFLFTRNKSDTLILWNDSDSSLPSGIDIDLPLGPAPRATTILGNTRTLPLTGENNLVHLTITSSPIILDHIDSRPVQLRASFALAASTFPAGAGAAHTEILLTNPYNETLAGTLRLSPPKGWTIDPPSIAISLAPGQSLRQPVTLHYPFSEYAGDKSLEARLTIDPPSGNAYDFSTPISIKSDLVDLDSSCQFLPNGDLAIQQVITNISNSTIDAQAYVMVPGYPREQRYIIGLAPKQTIIKRFTLPLSSYTPTNAAKITNPADLPKSLKGQTAAMGLRENNGRTLISKALPLQ